MTIKVIYATTGHLIPSWYTWINLITYPCGRKQESWKEGWTKEWGKHWRQPTSAKTKETHRIIEKDLFAGPNKELIWLYQIMIETGNPQTNRMAELKLGEQQEVIRRVLKDLIDFYCISLFEKDRRVETLENKTTLRVLTCVFFATISNHLS